jgi:hypothetical protein
MKNNCGKLAHVGTMDTGFTVIVIRAQWAITPEKKKKTSNL